MALKLSGSGVSGLKLDTALSVTSSGAATGSTTTDLSQGITLPLDVPSTDATLGGTEYVAVKQGSSFLRTTLSAIKTYILGAVPLASQFDSSTVAASTNFVQRALGNFQVLSILTASTTLTNAQSGSAFLVTGESLSITLPTSPVANLTYAIYAGYAFTLTSSSSIIGPNGSSTSVTIPAHESIHVICDGTNWEIVGGSLASSATSSLLTNLSTDTSTAVASTDSVTVAVGKLQGQISATAYHSGYVWGIRTGDNTFVFRDPWGTVIDASSSVTQGLNEALSYAATNGYNFKMDAGGVSGTTYPSYDKATIDCGANTVLVPNFQLRTVEFGAMTLNFSGSIGTNPGLLFDSYMMQNFRFDGQVVYAGNGYAVQVKPILAVPGDNLVTSIDSNIYIQTIAYIGGGTASDSACFAISGGSLTQRVQFRFTELNGANGSTIYAKYGVFLGDNCVENCTFDITGIHHVSSAGIQNGVSTSNVSRSGNTFRAGVIQPYGTSAEGYDGFQPNCQIELATDAGVGSYLRAVNLQSTASKNIVLLRQATGFTASTAVSDSSTGSHIIGSGYFQ